jgi:outer membrane receptor protein involved in Fe transport
MKFYLSLLTVLLVFAYTDLFSQDSVYNQLNPVIVTANKIREKRVESPIAISVISKENIEILKPTRIEFLLNTVSGVYMPSIGNEQHMMAIRQPISLKGLYLYLEDGMPIRTSGLFSNNALIEINTGAINKIEIIKGPASALYGAEAIGGVINVLTQAAGDKKLIQLNNQINSIGLFKSDLSIGIPSSKGGWVINTNYAAQNKGPIDYSDYIKKGISIRHDFEKGRWSGYQSLQYIDYFAQMTGSVDSVHFASHNFNSLQTFTFRKINALRIRQNLNYRWSENANTVINVMYRNNAMDQNPTYAIANTSNPTKFKGQVNRNEFNALVMDVQHIVSLKKLNSKLILGATGDFTNQNLKAHYIDIFKDTLVGKYTKYIYPAKDSLVSNYQTKINNQAVYVNFISKFGAHIKTNLAVRYDHFEYRFANLLNTGTPSSNNNFSSIIPKLGITYNQNIFGLYANYSEGFVPPQITEIYNAIRVPYLLPQTFKNIEAGGWINYQKWYSEISVYQLNGNNEIISVRQSDGVNLNQNSGSTKHIGIEYQLKYKPTNAIEFNWSATNAKHNYIATIIKGVDVSGNEMSAAPRFWSNLSTTIKLNNKLSSHLEWQHQSSYFMDETNATKYPGFDVLNLRLNYSVGKSAFWLHILNVTNSYYSTMATKNFSVKGNAAYSYYMGEPRSIAIGWKWSLNGPF